jgi:hypothetical protein
MKPENGEYALDRLEMLALEQQDREGYLKRPQEHDETLVWETEAVWPVEQSLEMLGCDSNLIQ